MVRPYLKSGGQTLNGLTARLDGFKARGIDALEIFAPCKGGMCYHGLDTLDYYEIDPAIGGMEDFLQLVREAHRRSIAVIIFINLGYGHEQFPAFLKACADVRAGIDSPEARMFCWSETGQGQMDRRLAPHFMNDLHGNWRWSERAQKYFWVKWEGEKGGYHLPQFNFGDPGWQNETRRIIDYWLRTGIDGMVIDAVNWYINANWEITRYSMTDLINLADNQFSQPEGAGGFTDSPRPWVEQGGFNCIMDYAIKKWWEARDVIREAVLQADPRPIEAALLRYRDPVVAAGGVCYIDPPNLRDQVTEAYLLGTATVATMGELLLLHDNQLEGELPEYRRGLERLCEARRRYPALCAAGQRLQVETRDDRKFYAYLRSSKGAGPAMLVVLNFQPDPYTIQVRLGNQNAAGLVDIWSGERVNSTRNRVEVRLPGFGYGIYKIEEGELK
jgi:glycosidase